MAKFRRRGKRRFGKRKRFLRRKSSKIFKRRVKRIINQTAEKKYIDATATTFVTNVGYFFVVNSGLSQGDTATTRTGNEVYARSLKMRLLFLNNSTEQLVYWRVIVGCWKDYSVTSPSTTNILEAPTNQTLSPYYRLALQQRKWTPMYDKTFELNNSTAATSGSDVRSIIKILKLSFSGKRLPMKRIAYNAGSIPDHCYFVLMINSFAGAGNQPSAQGYARMTFTDV